MGNGLSKKEQEQLLNLKNKGAKEYEIAKRNNAENLEELHEKLKKIHKKL